MSLAGSHRTSIDAAIIRRPLIDGRTDAIVQFGGRQTPKHLESPLSQRTLRLTSIERPPIA
jgi:hypothetical protein